VEPYIGYGASIVICAVGTAMSLMLAHTLPLEPGTAHPLLVPAGLATLFTGCLLLVSRKKALTQVVGYLVLENGIFLFSLMLVQEMPLLVEAGILLDLCRRLGADTVIPKPVDFQNISAMALQLGLQWTLLKPAPAALVCTCSDQPR